MSNVSRRSLLRTSAWSIPAVTVAAASPAFANSQPRKDPGINGWLQVNYPNPSKKGFAVKFDSDPSGKDPQTPDGALFGLYVYDMLPTDLLSAATITLWFRGKVDSWSEGTGSNTSNGGGHGNGWSNPVYAGSQVKPDGDTYYGYRFDYTGSFTLAGGLVWLQDIEITAKGVKHSDATFWVERRIAVNGQVHTFQRRNGERGPLGEGFPAGRVSGFSATPSAGNLI